jgi:hypothetical protein
MTQLQFDHFLYVAVTVIRNSILDSRIPLDSAIKKTYQVCLKILNRSVPTNFGFNGLVRWSPVGNPDVPAIDDLVSPRRLSMVEVICRVVEL